MRDSVRNGLIWVAVLMSSANADNADPFSQIVTMDLGKPAPNVEFFDTKSISTSLTTFRGKWVFLHFWATWCQPCISELPEIMKLMKQKPVSEKFVFVLVSVDKLGQKIVPKFLKKHRLTYLPVYFDPDSTAAAEFGVERFPTTYLINPQGLLTKKIAASIPWSQEKAIRILMSDQK